MVKHTLYNAYTKVPFFCRKSIIGFLLTKSGSPEVTQSSIKEAIDYATKEIPSFGGFILVAEKENEILGVAIINKTGLNGGNPKHRIVYFAVQEISGENEIASKIIQDAIHYAKGDISFRVRQDDAAMNLYESLGFQAKFVEMRLTKQTTQLPKKLSKKIPI